MKDEMDVNFTGKRQARLASRLTRNQAKKNIQAEFVELEPEDCPSSSAVQAILDLKNQAKQKSTSSPETVKVENVSESHDRNAKSPACYYCLESRSQVQSLKDDISELHKEILKLKR